MKSTLSALKQSFRAQASPRRAKKMQWFFKTGKGDYGHGDVFLGLSVPQQRMLAKTYRRLPLSAVAQLLRSRIHEHRLTAVLILGLQFSQSDDRQRRKIVDTYLQHTKYINNWDIVDSSAPYILGPWLQDKPRDALFRLAKSKNLWERRIAIIATQAFIRRGDFRDTLRLAKVLLLDPHDLIHKAVGWMLREVGNRDRKIEERFLARHAATMPRTMLRYAIEKFPARRRQQLMKQEKVR